MFAPATEAEAAALVAEAAARGTPLSIIGGGSKLGLGRPTQTQASLSSAALTGITLHESAELVIAARAGTPLAEVERALADKGQHLPFEPMDYRALLGTSGEPTIGGMAAGNISGPRRIQAGACRDSFLGARLINGRGETIKSGGRVMKNVTGLDLTRLMAGSFGTLGLLTEVTFKTLPVAETQASLVIGETEHASDLTIVGVAAGQPDGTIALSVECVHEIHGAGPSREQLLDLRHFVRSDDPGGHDDHQRRGQWHAPRLVDLVWRGVSALLHAPYEQRR